VWFTQVAFSHVTQPCSTTPGPFAQSHHPWYNWRGQWV